MTKSSRDFPYVFLLSKNPDQWEMDKWCTEHFGKRWSVVDNRQGVWCCFWRGARSPGPGKYEWYFQNERDANWFILRWGGQ